MNYWIILLIFIIIVIIGIGLAYVRGWAPLALITGGFFMGADDVSDCKPIKWKNNPIPAEILNSLFELIGEYKTFKAITPDEEKSLKEGLAEINKKHKSNISLEQLIALRNVVVLKRVIKATGRVKKFSKKLSKELSEGKSIKELSETYGIPPLNTLRYILRARGWERKKISEAFKDTSQLPEDLRKDFEYANANDITAESIEDKEAAAKKKHIDAVVKYLKNAGITAEIPAQPADSETDAAPDILIKEPFCINDKRVKWINVKNAPLVEMYFLKEKTRNEAEKHNDNIGPGAVVFAWGLADGVDISDVLVLDGTSIGAAKAKK